MAQKPTTPQKPTREQFIRAALHNAALFGRPPEHTAETARLRAAELRSLARWSHRTGGSDEHVRLLLLRASRCSALALTCDAIAR